MLIILKNTMTTNHNEADDLTIKPLHYTLIIDISIDDKLLKAESRIKLLNAGAEPVDRFQLLLNRGLNVTAIEYDKGDVSFTQRRDRFKDLNEMVVNTIDVFLDKPLKAGDTVSMHVTYEGEISSYEDVFTYIKDRISEEYTLIRTDAFSYPVLGVMEFKQLISLLTRQRVGFELKVTVPTGYKVANVGKLLSYVETDDKVTFTYVSKLPSWRIDIAVSEFNLLSDEALDLHVFALETDHIHAGRILRELMRCLRFYRGWFGDPAHWAGYTVIEVPEGWGSQADVTGMLLEAKSFRDEQRVESLYHELAHLWNVTSGEKIPSRFLDEGFATYLQLLAVREFFGENVFEEKLDRFRQRAMKMAEDNPILLEIPVASYGEYGVTDASYFVGAWVLYILHRVVGDRCFRDTIRTFLKRYRDKPATLEDFKQTALNICGTKVDRLLNEWLFGNKAIQYLKQNTPVEELLKIYNPHM